MSQQQPQPQPREDPEERDQRLTERQLQQMGVQQAYQAAERMRSDLLEKVSESDLNADSRNLLENLVSKDFIFANLTDEEVTEFKYQLLNRRKAFYVMHPSSESIIEGDLRAYVYDDAGNELTSLTQQERLIVDQFFHGIHKRVTRARGMKQQKILKTQIQQSMTGSLEESESSGGLLGRLRS